MKPCGPRLRSRWASLIAFGRSATCWTRRWRFQHESDARRFWNEMRERLQEFALTLHPEKNRLIEFGRIAAENRKRRGFGKPETFTFLGFTFICSKTRRGKFQIKRKSRRDRMREKLQAIKQELLRRMHQPIPQQGRWLKQVVTGYFNYHAVPTNGPTPTAFLFPRHQSLAAHAAAAEPEGLDDLGADQAVGVREAVDIITKLMRGRFSARRETP